MGWQDKVAGMCSPCSGIPAPCEASGRLGRHLPLLGGGPASAARRMGRAWARMGHRTSNRIDHIHRIHGDSDVNRTDATPCRVCSPISESGNNRTVFAVPPRAAPIHQNTTHPPPARSPAPRRGVERQMCHESGRGPDGLTLCV